ncbi:MAG: 30S ribosomal protein S6 [Longimicrobiales bacterium]
MNAYETVYIFDSQITEEQIGDKIERYHNQLSSTGAEVTAVEHWGRRQLAYPIRKRTNGYYVVAQFQAEVTGLPEFERLLKLDEELLRYLVVVHEGEPTTPMSIATREPGRERDEDEDEE